MSAARSERDAMSTLQVAGRKSLMLLSGRAYPELADEIAAHIGVTVTPTTARDFANGETVHPPGRVGARHATRSSSSRYTTPINQWVMETLILVDALKRASAKRITVVAPFYPYARQDKKHRGREPISARLIADLFKTAGRRPADGRRPAHRADPGLLRRPGRPPVRAAAARRSYVLHKLRRRGPHRRLARHRPGADGRAVGRRARRPATSRSCTRPATSTRPTRSSPTGSSARSPAGCCLLIDDMIDTGGSITKAADLLFDTGATDVDRRRHARRLLRRRPPTGSRTAGSAR